MSRIETKIPPPLVAVLCGLGLWGAATLWPALGRPDNSQRTFAALAIGLIGIAIDMIALWPFLRARTTIHPMHPERSTALVTTGLYAHSRNPMYVGQALLLTGFALWTGHAAGLLAIAIFVVWITRFQIIPEERVLTAKFPADFAAYRARVRRWL